MSIFKQNIFMKNIKLLAASLLFSGIFPACSYSPPEPAEDPTNPRTPPVAGSADFSKYVAVGNSITAGFMDNALYLEGQQNAYPVILAERMKTVNGDKPFNFPALGTAGGAGFGSTAPGPGGTTIVVGRLKFLLPTCPVAAATKTLGLTPGPTLPGEPLTPYTGNKADLNNFGVPGAKSFHVLVPGYGINPALGNPFFWRIASAPTASVIGDAAAAKPTFFTYWLGANDLLSYATSGGSGNANPGLNPSNYGPNDMTDPLVFGAALKGAIDALLAAGANTKGAVATVPDVVKIPFFQLVNAGLTAGGPNAPIPFNLSAAQVTALNAGYAQLGPAADGVNFKVGKVNYPVIATATGLRHMDPTKDFLTLLTPQDNLLAGPISACNPAQRANWGISVPIPNQYVLDQAEATLVTNRVTAFNNIIKQEVASRNNRVALVEINITLGNLTAAQNTLAPPAGLFSLDGVHPNPRGQALIANAFIKAINTTFSATLPPVKLQDYRLNTLPSQ
ncbi:MAG: family lipolytic protein [Adhaeribacter sp.]|nr:family lipolytic protein [Adhaeribacter sp.]